MKKILVLMFVMCIGFLTINAKTTNYRNALIFVYDRTNCIFEDENIILEIYDQGLWIKNKTRKTIYVDMSQCFLNHNGTSRPIYSTDKDEKHASQLGTSTSISQFLNLAPSTGAKQNATYVCNMASGIFGIYSTTESPWGEMTEYDKRLLELVNELIIESKKGDRKGKEFLGTATRHLLEDESINNLGASIAYSFSKNSEEWKNVSISTWVSDVIFAPYYITYPQELSKKDFQGFDLKKTEKVKINVKAESPFEFEKDKSPLVVTDWEGNFEKGTFKLFPIEILANKPYPFVLFSMERARRHLEKRGGVTLYNSSLPAGVAGDWVAQSFKSIVLLEGISVDWGKMKYSKYICDAIQD